MTAPDTKQALTAALAAFGTQPLPEAARAFFAALGYASEKRIVLQPNSAETFAATFAHGQAFNAKAALVDEWQSVDMLFQLTDDEIRAATSNQQSLLFDSKGTFYNTIINSYLFFAIALQPRVYTRTELAGITRAINCLFPMPVMLLLQAGATITLSVINRRLHKRDRARDVLEKVTLIKDIQCAAPHRAHLEILHDLSLNALCAARPCDEDITSFVALHNAWQKTLDVQVLNRRFFTEVRNWFYWARLTARFPAGAPKDADGCDSDALIRLLTRLIFCWFVKEKGLIPTTLFNQSSLQAILNGYAPDDDHNTNSIFYKAILQNLFFATLNTEMDRRDWAKDEHNFMAHSLYRFRECFTKPGEALTLFKNIPFLNGGLFECLDKDRGEGTRPRYIRIDGFSRRPDCQPIVPDFLFFGHARLVPEIAATLGERNAPKARGLFLIFRDYKFTVEENTPLEEDIALDPELAGRIFENLLAAYNPETGVTARKQTGSFYTPREIVNYMVDESLIAYLKTKLETSFPSAKEVEARLRHLLAYNDEPHKFSGTDVDALIAAIDNLKALDPAVGSGAFPMGMLHRLVFLLHKLDPENTRWRERQRQRAIRETEETFKIGDRDERARRLEDINNVFEQNASDYGRKLYLIENCIYGVDIQPVAVQIAKMRFFISLVADQKIADTQPNRGVRPLPNLETKFVAANSLIGIDRPVQQLLRNPEIDAKELQLRHVREKHFLARTPAAKAKCREQDAKLRAEIATLLKDDGWDTETAKKLSAWDPYDQNASAPFFDPEWMFGVVAAACRRAAPATMAGKFTLVNESPGQAEFVENETVKGGFDIVLGNPPYVRQEALGQEFKQYAKQHFASYAGTADLFVYFFERSHRVLRPGGFFTMICSNKYMRSNYGKPLRSFLTTHARILQIIDFGELPVFENAATFPSIILTQNSAVAEQHFLFLAIKKLNQHPLSDEIQRLGSFLDSTALRGDNWTLASGGEVAIFEKMKQKGIPLGEYVKGKIYYGIKTGLNEAFIIDRATRDRLIAEDARSAELIKPFVVGDDVRKYHINFRERYLILMPCGWTRANLGKVRDPWQWLSKTYPAIAAHLAPFESAAQKRCDKGEYWWELRPCDYYAEFEKPKIVWPEIAMESRYALDEDGLSLNKTCFFTPCCELTLLGILNSRPVWFFLKKLCSVLGDADKRGRLLQQKIYIERIPVPLFCTTDSSNKQSLSTLALLVEKILAAKKKNPAADVTTLERAIDEIVYRLYGLTPEEIKIVEAGT